MWPTAVQARARYCGLCIVTSALAPLSLPHPVVRTPSSDLRASDSVPRVLDIGLAPPDPRNLRTTSGRPSPRSSGRPTSLGHLPGSSAPVLRTSGPDLCLVRIFGPEPGSPSSETSGTSGRPPVVSLLVHRVDRPLSRVFPSIPSTSLELTSWSRILSCVELHSHI
ncbi:hypothetical protein K438DRAFT_1869699, partial [Mycena galopus ATCC 62051]